MKKLAMLMALALIGSLLISYGVQVARANPSNLAGLWHLDEGIGTAASDSSGNANNGVLTDADIFNTDSNSPPSWVAGKFKTALDFDGVDDFVSVPDDPSLDITLEITLEAWFKAVDFALPPGQGDANIYLISKDTSGSRSYGIGVTDVDLAPTSGCGPGGAHAFMIAFTTGGIALACGSTPISTGAFHHVAGVYDSSTGVAKVYVDGIVDGTASVAGGSTLVSGSADVQIGARQYPGFRAFFHGVIDEARIWSRVLVGSEVLASAQAGLRGVWHFNENSGTAASDSSDYGNSGTLTNGPSFAAGRFGNGVRLDGVNDFVDVTDAGVLDISGDFTVEAWVELDVLRPGGLHNVIAKERSSLPFNANYNMHILGNKVFLAVTFNAAVSGSAATSGVAGCDPGGCFVKGVTSLTAGVSYHVGGVYDDSAKKLTVYLNGFKDGEGTFTTTGSPTTNNENLRIGRRNADPTGATALDGTIDEMHLWARALSNAEIGFLAAPSTAAELFLPNQMKDKLGSGAVFTSVWQVGTRDRAMGLAFIVPDVSGTTISSIVPRSPKPTTPPGTVADLVDSVTGLSGMAALITVDRGEVNPAKTLHLDTALSDPTKLGMQFQWKKNS